MRCAGCKHFERGIKYGHPDWPGSGHCARWTDAYGANAKALKPNECWVESDEGWGNIVGPEFGCVLFDPDTKQGACEN